EAVGTGGERGGGGGQRQLRPGTGAAVGGAGVGGRGCGPGRRHGGEAGGALAVSATLGPLPAPPPARGPPPPRPPPPRAARAVRAASGGRAVPSWPWSAQTRPGGARPEPMARWPAAVPAATPITWSSPTPTRSRPWPPCAAPWPTPPWTRPRSITSTPTPPAR